MDIEYINIGTADAYPQKFYPPHAHPYHETIIVLQGELHVRIGGETYCGKVGDILFYEAENPHAECSPEGDTHTFFVGVDLDIRGETLPVLSYDHDGRLRQLVQWFYQGGPEEDVSSESQQAFAMLFWNEFKRVREHYEPSLVRRVRAYMREHLSEPLSLETLAQTANMSKYHFLRKYRAMTDHTPMQDLRLMRLQYCRELIMTTDVPLKAIAAKAGLSSDVQMSRLFRQYLNTTPGQLKKAHRL